MNQRWWLYIERAQATLPLLAVAALAGFTWWLVASSPKDGRAVVPPLSSSVPDYQLEKARVVRFDAEGRLQAILDGTAMRHYPGTDRLVIDELELSARDDDGQGLHAVALEGEADNLAEVVHLRGDVRVVAMPPVATADAPAQPGGPVHFAGEGLRIDTRKRIVASEQPVTITQDYSQIEAQSIVYNDHSRVADLGGRVHGRYAVPAAEAARKGRP